MDINEEVIEIKNINISLLQQVEEAKKEVQILKKICILFKRIIIKKKKNVIWTMNWILLRLKKSD